MSKLLLSYLLGFLPYIKIMLYLSALPTNPIVTPNSHQHEGKNYTQLIFLHPYLAPSTVAWAQNGCSISGKKTKRKNNFGTIYDLVHSKVRSLSQEFHTKEVSPAHLSQWLKTTADELAQAGCLSRAEMFGQRRPAF